MRTSSLVVIALIGVINIEGRHQQIFVRQTPVVNPPHLIQPVRYARPPRYQPASFPRPPRHANARNSVLKKSSKSAPSLKQSRPVPSVPRSPNPAPAPYVPQQKPAVKYSQYVAPQQVRNERQVSAKNYNTPISTHKTKPVNHKKFIPGVAQIIAVPAHQAPEKTSKSVAPTQIRSERQVTTKSYNTPISTDKTSPDNSYQSTPIEAKKPAVTAPQAPAKTPKHVAPKPIRSERQVTAKNYDTSISTGKTTPDNSYKSSPVEVKKPTKVLAKTPKYVAPKQIRSERQVPSKSYNSPLSTYNSAPATSYKTTSLKAQPSTIEARQVATPRQPSYSATGRSNQEPIAITRYVYNSPTGEEQEGDDVFNYEFETENGIKQSAQGTMRMVNDAPVVVMRGSYEYIDNGVTYEVVWEADENGFRPSAPKSKHLPRVVAIPFPEQQDAVDAQLRFAAEETRLRAAASENPTTYIAGDQPLSGYTGQAKRV